MEIIDVPEMNDSMLEFTIDDTVYTIRFTYNELKDYWSFSLYDEDENPIIVMVRIVPNWPLFHFYSIDGMPKGQFACISDNEDVGYDALINGDAQFVYITNEELAEEDEEEDEE